jgi:hypothetical protein
MSICICDELECQKRDYCHLAEIWYDELCPEGEDECDLCQEAIDYIG